LRHSSLDGFIDINGNTDTLITSEDTLFVSFGDGKLYAFGE
jgi:hypothetical protein